MQQQTFAARTANPKRESRVHGQYLAHVLEELRKSENGDMENELDMYTRGKRPLTVLRTRN